MMELLITNPRQILSTERFMEKIWGYDSEAGSRSCMGIYFVSQKAAHLSEYKR